MSLINTPISVGELLDKITILEIKSEKIKDAEKLKNINHELSLLTEIWSQGGFDGEKMAELRRQLKTVNQTLWVIEDDIRIKEKNQIFDDSFVQLARSVYFENDTRAQVKKDINKLTGSELVEEKSYEDYK
ncbi:DUF6165 family protein [Marinicella rhabdoformis]|uniref:DUF6165 family protein n=1 Tax=Marinicella rhabdoformis TaxID=2580566 RepID=UPI0012AEDC41|nr:DUF6165 family protein [Marinicella rhabdoformis]